MRFGDYGNRLGIHTPHNEVFLCSNDFLTVFRPLHFYPNRLRSLVFICIPLASLFPSSSDITEERSDVGFYPFCIALLDNDWGKLENYS